MKKQTPIDFKTPDGKKVTVIVNRTWGYEPHTVRMSDDPFETEEGLPMMKFMDSVDFSAKVDGREYEKVRIVPSYFSPSNLGIELNFDTVVDLPQEVWDKIRFLKDERLNDELSPFTLKSIQHAKECIAKGRVISRKEIERRSRKEGWNPDEMGNFLIEAFGPYADYITSEALSELKRKYPEHFRVEITREYVGGKIRAAREKSGMTLRELAAKTGLTYSHIARIEKGEHNVSLDTLATLLNTLGLSFEIV